MIIDEEDAQFAILKKALEFANCKQEHGESDKHWAKRATKRLQVVGSSTRMGYAIDFQGHVSTSGDDGLTPRVVKKCYQELRAALDTLVRSREKPEPKRIYLGASKNTLRFDFSAVAGLWVRYEIHGGTKVTPRIVVPMSLSALVAYAVLLLSKKPWISRLRMCHVKHCGKYYLPKSGHKAGRPREVCSDQCEKRRGGNAERQRRYRERKKHST